MADDCAHLDTINQVMPSAKGCEECLASDSWWVHLRLCRTCGHVGCCDDSPNRHATKHFHATGHPIIEGYDPPEGWGWCFVDEMVVDLPDQTPQLGPIPKFVRCLFPSRKLEGVRGGLSALDGAPACEGEAHPPSPLPLAGGGV